ncbi:MAG: hypothetical protein AAF415_17160 [Pseudomonadota bacterium]
MQEAVNSAFGDAGTILPEGIDRPCHWDREKQPYTPLKYDTAYQNWLAAGAPATGPCPE